MPGKFYTLQEAKELVDFCQKRHVMLIPEIDMQDIVKPSTGHFRQICKVKKE